MKHNFEDVMYEGEPPQRKCKNCHEYFLHHFESPENCSDKYGVKPISPLDERGEFTDEAIDRFVRNQHSLNSLHPDFNANSENPLHRDYKAKRIGD